MKKITLLMTMLLLFAITGSYSQSAATYGFTSTTGTYTENSGAATAIAGVRADTFISAAQNIGFTFVYEGNNYTQFKMSSNGFISLNIAGTASLTTNDFSTANATSRPILAPLWDDLDGATPTTSLASYELTGVAPNRVLTVEWRNWEWNWNSGATPVISFQVKLYETTNVIEFAYRQEAGAVASGSASIGIGSATGSGAGSYLNLTSVASPAVSSSTSTTNINTKPATDQIFRFTPPTPCSGTPVAGSVIPTLQNICTGTTPANLVASGYSNGVTGLTFQWEESNDDGATDAWAPAVGGTGATTATYTPPAFSGTPIYYRLNVTCTNSALSSQTASVMVATPVNPTTQITAVTIPAATIGYSQAIVNWTNGNGTRRAVFISDNATFTDPVNGNAPALTPNTVYTGSGQQLIFDGTTATVTVTGLSAGTQYYIKAYEYVRCGSGPYDYYYNVSTGTNIGTFTTCGIFAVPALEDFTTYVPGCWQEADNGDLLAGPSTFGASSWVADGPLNVGTTGAMRVNLDATGDNDWILSPLYTIPANYELKFDASAHQWNSTAAPTTAWETDDFVEVLVSTGTTNWEILYTYNNANVPSNTGTPNVIDLDLYAGQTVRFAFRGVEGATNGGADIEFIVDNFEVRETPPCVEPTTLSTGTITADSAELFWVDPTGTQFDFEYVVQPAGGGTPVTNGTSISDVTVIEGGLSANTNYEFWVRADCGGAGYSAWVGPFTFRTPCANFVAPWTYDVEAAATTTNSSIADCWTSNPTNTTGAFRWDVDGAGSTPSTGTGPSGAYSGVKYFYTEASSGTTGAIAYLAPVSVDVTALTTPYLEFYYHMFGVNMGTLEVEVFDGSVWTSVWTLSGQQQTAETDPWIATGIDMSAYAVSNVLTFRFKATRGTSFEGDMSLDNISVIEAPACIAPSALTLSSVGTDQATFIWNANSGETNWEYVIQPQGTGTPVVAGTPTTNNPLTVTTGLTSNTAYEIYIRAFCGGSDYSTWVGPLNFRTSIEVVCGTPVNTTYCYTDNDTTSWIFTSSDGSPLRVTFNAGQVENNWDELIILDSDGVTQLYNGYGAAGNLAGLTFDSTGDTVTVMISSDGSANCGDSAYTPWDFDVTCATCVNPTATFTTVPGCGSGQYSIDVNVTDLGSATSLSISDGTTTLTNITATGIQTFGPYTSGSPVTIVLTNEQDGACTLSSGTVNYICPPANDECVNATPVNCGDVVTGTTASGATNSGNNASADVWYSYSGAAGDITVSLCNNTNYDSYLRVFDACGGTQLAFNDDGCAAQSTVTFTANGTSTYYIMVEGFGSNVGNFEMAVTCVLGNEDFDSNSFSAYPNPVKDVLNVSYTSEISSIRVINMIGQEIISKNINSTSTQVDMSQLSAGTYIVNVTIGDAVKTLKVVKQ